MAQKKDIRKQIIQLQELNERVADLTEEESPTIAAAKIRPIMQAARKHLVLNKITSYNPEQGERCFYHFCYFQVDECCIKVIPKEMLILIKKKGENAITYNFEDALGEIEYDTFLNEFQFQIDYAIAQIIKNHLRLIKPELQDMFSQCLNMLDGAEELCQRYQAQLIKNGKRYQALTEQFRPQFNTYIGRAFRAIAESWYIFNPCSVTLANEEEAKQTIPIGFSDTDTLLLLMDGTIITAKKYILDNGDYFVHEYTTASISGTTIHPTIIFHTLERLVKKIQAATIGGMGSVIQLI